MAMLTKRNRGRAVGGSAAMAAVVALGYRAEATATLDGRYRVEVWQLDPELLVWTGPPRARRHEAIGWALEHARAIFGVVVGLAAGADEEN